MRDRLDAADLFALTSWDPEIRGAGAESFGIVFAEATARGVPCLAARAGGVVDILEDGTNAVLIDDAQPETIAAGLDRFAVMRGGFDPEMIAAGARRFTWPKIADRFEALLAAGAAREAA